jgi:hypothetical protein
MMFAAIAVCLGEPPDMSRMTPDQNSTRFSLRSAIAV